MDDHDLKRTTFIQGSTDRKTPAFGKYVPRKGSRRAAIVHFMEMPARD